MAFELMQKTLDLVFPNLCLHCQAKTEKRLFCLSCLESLQLLSTEALTLYRQKLDNITVAFAKMGVAESLFLNLKKGLKPLKKIAASYMVCQLQKENPTLCPDIIVPLPSKAGEYRLNESLALEIGTMFKSPIKRLFLPLPISFFGSAWALKKSDLFDKKTLLVMAEYEEKTVQKAVSQLKKQGFKNIQAVALCA